MTSYRKSYISLIFTAALFVSIRGNIHSQEDGFTFDSSEDFKEDVVQPPRIEFDDNHYEAFVGKVFHLDLRPLGLGKEDQSFEAEQQNRKSLPQWLVFSKKTGSFWGIPSPDDEGPLHITISLQGDNRTIKVIHVRVIGDDLTTMEKCEPNKENNEKTLTVLILLLDKDIREMKPKERVVAVDNLARFFKLPLSAFTLKPQFEKDNINDNSVIRAGPGNVHEGHCSYTGASFLEILVGCSGQLWKSSEHLIHNIEQQAKDGTIAEVLRVPVLGWRVKIVTKPILRIKRQAVEEYGSGDYDDYYDDYDEYNEEDDLGDVEANPPDSKKPITLPTSPATTSRITTTSTSTTTTTVPTSTHPHRHHHGEVKTTERFVPDSVSGIREEVLRIPEEPESITQPSSTSTSRAPEDPGPTKIDIPRPPDDPVVDNEYDYDLYDDDNEEDDDEAIESATIVPDQSKTYLKPIAHSTSTVKELLTPAGELETEITTMKMSTVTYSTTTTTTTTEAPTTFEIIEDTEPPNYTIIFNEGTTPIVTSTTSNATTENVAVSANSTTTSTASPTTTSTTTTASTTSQLPTTTQVVTSQEILPTTQSSTTVVSEYPTTETEPSTKTSTVRHVPSTTTEEMIVTETVEQVNRYIPIPRNTKPYIENRLQYQSITAGKVFRFVIPRNTFKDPEDGYNLTLQVLDKNEQPLSKDSWLQFNPVRRELYGLPLPNDIFNWKYILRAFDKEGAYEQDELTVQVQQHKLERVVNHEFVLKLRIEKPQGFPHYVDWSLKVLRALGLIYGTNMSEITVRHINYTSEPVIFAWSNDSLPTTYCPRSDIEELYKLLTANDRGDPSRELNQMLFPDLRAKKVVNRYLTICEPPPPPPVTPISNFSPILRNPVDEVNATLGELLIYKVKDDTFYDPEDVDPSTLNITLLTSDLGAIPPNNWLQFDTKNQEFYGIPRKTGRTEYFLLCVDTGGMSAKDSLEVVVHPATKKQYNVEFSMTIGVPYESFSNNAVMQRKFVEKLMKIFEEPTPNNFHFLPFKPKREPNFESTVVYWFNKSLPIENCPTEHIKQLEYLLHSDSRSISSRVHRIMGPDFTVSTIKVHHIGNCKAKPQTIPAPDIVVPSEETTAPQAENDMMITLILPIIIIAIMLFIAFVAACVLYRKRRMGKMNVEEDGRQSYGNKGIPVIFQEELDEKPEPGTKAPVILKDERPPLAPPEYSKSGSVKLEDSEPYQPPPPFTRTQDNGRQPRPKPTPTYRKPPPYVPP